MQNRVLLLALLLAGFSLTMVNDANARKSLRGDGDHGLSDAEIKTLAAAAAKTLDAQHSVAAGNAHSLRLTKLVPRLSGHAGLTLNFKVYGSDEVNVLAFADGSIRIHAGLFEQMTDDELLFVLGHEIGHIKHGHSQQQLRAAYVATATGAFANRDNTPGTVATAELASIVDAIIDARFSEMNELQADRFGLELMKERGIDPRAAVSALEKLAKLGSSKGPMLSTHPFPTRRAIDLRKQL